MTSNREQPTSDWSQSATTGECQRLGRAAVFPAEPRTPGESFAHLQVAKDAWTNRSETAVPYIQPLKNFGFIDPPRAMRSLSRHLVKNASAFMRYVFPHHYNVCKQLEMETGLATNLSYLRSLFPNSKNKTLLRCGIPRVLLALHQLVR